MRFRRNFGQTAAMAAGFDRARGAYLVPMDADLQNDPDDIPMLLARLEEGFDIVSGWRKNRQDKALTRRLPSKIANWLIGRVSGVRLHDYGCTLKAYRREVLEPVRLYGEMHRFIPVYAKWSGARITEQVVRHHARKEGKSKYGLARTLKVLLDLTTVKFLGDYSTKPLYLFGSWGVAVHRRRFRVGRRHADREVRDTDGLRAPESAAAAGGDAVRRRRSADRHGPARRAARAHVPRIAAKPVYLIAEELNVPAAQPPPVTRTILPVPRRG